MITVPLELHGLVQRIVNLEQQVEKLIEQKNKLSDTKSFDVCPVCGIKLEGTMSFTCSNMKCPVLPQVTSFG